MKKIFLFVAVLIIIALGAYYLSKRPSSPSPSTSTTNQALENKQAEKSKPQETVPTGPAGVAIDDFSAQVTPGSWISIKWTVTTPAQATVKSTAIYYDTKSHAGAKGFGITAAMAGYASAVRDYISGTFVVPASFTANFYAPKTPGTVYLRAHALIDGKNYWTDEKQVIVK